MHTRMLGNKKYIIYTNVLMLAPAPDENNMSLCYVDVIDHHSMIKYQLQQ